MVFILDRVVLESRCLLFEFFFWVEGEVFFRGVVKFGFGFLKD